jgi:hypothetical protein
MQAARRAGYHSARVRTGPDSVSQSGWGPTIPTNQPLIDYVQFAQACQNSATASGHFDRASFFIDGAPRQQ